MGYRFDIFSHLLRRTPVRHGDIEKLALADVRYGGIAQAVQRGADGLALRVEDGGLERNEDTRFHKRN